MEALETVEPDDEGLAAYRRLCEHCVNPVLFSHSS